jgi:formylglycine-generating enzyme required for sulfatase activity
MRTLTLFTLLFVVSYSYAQDKAKIEKLLKFVKVEGGTFLMGDNSITYFGQKEAAEHEVEISTFYIQTTELTQELWEVTMGSNPSEDKSRMDNPVSNVSWNDCQEFIKKLNLITGKKYRLPTEAEWEYAARGGKLSKGYKYAGSDNLDEVAWYSENSNKKIHPVAKKKPNELGLYDMSGNVWEWCQDWYSGYIVEIMTNPRGPDNGETKIIRGGSWNFVPAICRLARRHYGEPSQRGNRGGFRLVSPGE